ncbi:MAG: helix-turn-helix domain-containing protein [Acidobacteriota bacterium]|nr:helix-turn-helix domain-containing protein [Acidobacteriota bacterium]
MSFHRQQPEWMDLKALQQYACVSERTIRAWIKRPAHPLPASRVCGKILIKRSGFDSWIEGHQMKKVDVSCIVDEQAREIMRER